MTVLLGTAAAVLVAPVAAQADAGCAVMVDSTTVKEEANAQAVFHVHRADAVACASPGASFDFTLSDGPVTPDAGAAVKGADYVPATQTHVVWNDLDAPIIIAVPILDDSNGEGDELFSIQLTNPVNLVLVASTTDPTAGHATARILASDPLNALTFFPNYDCWEWPEDNCQVQIQFGVTPPQDVTITLDTFDSEGGASAGRDYVPVHDRIVVPAGSSKVDIQLTILNDDTREPTESFGLRFAMSSGDDSGGGSTVVRIHDGPLSGS
jgi:hypothetical protein